MEQKVEMRTSNSFVWEEIYATRCQFGGDTILQNSAKHVPKYATLLQSITTSDAQIRN